MYTSNMTYIRHDLYICELEGYKAPYELCCIYKYIIAGDGVFQSKVHDR
jgi:hypothetical protein